MYKIGVMGDYDSISVFSALGFDIFSVQNMTDAHNRLTQLLEQDYGIIYVTEDYFGGLSDLIELAAKRKTPAISVLPAANSDTGTGRKILKGYVEKAVGSDIVFND